MGTAAATVESRGFRAWAIWRRPPGWIFYFVVALAALLALFAISVPAESFGPLSTAFLLFVLAALIWSVRAVTYLSATRHERAVGHPAWLLVGPIAGILTVAIAAADLPLRARWALSRDAFEDAVAEAGRDPDDESDRDRRIGLYDVTRMWKEGDAVLFTEATGGFIFNSGGFAYLPDGPDAVDTDLHLQHLGGPWYAWT